MKVLLVHNFYRSSSPSGEDIVFSNELDLLNERGVEVITYTKSNDSIGRGKCKLKAALTTIWSTESYSELKTLINKERPDIAHFHNIWYLISPSAYYACKESGIPIVQTCHNFRIFCASGLLARQGKICEMCLNKMPWRGIMYGCYRDSKLHTIPVALSEGLHKVRNTWSHIIDIYIALSSFEKTKLTEGGLPPNKIYVKPHFLTLPQPFVALNTYILFIGRLSKEKGCLDLLNALILLKRKTSDHIKFMIVGDGPLKEKIRYIIEKERLSSVELLERRSHTEVLNIIRNAQCVVVPSICYETFSLAILEAFACGKAVVASRLGAMAELVEEGKTGLLFEPGNAEDLALKLKWMIDNEDACVQMGKNARAEFEAKYTAERNYELLMQIYQKAIKGEGASG